MPIVIERRNEAPACVGAMSAEQRDELWGEIVKAYIKKHPEVLSDVDAETM